MAQCPVKMLELPHTLSQKCSNNILKLDCCLILILHFCNKSDTSIIMLYIWISIILLISKNNPKTNKKNKCVYFAPMCYPNRKKRTRHDDYILHNLQGVFPFWMPLRRRLKKFFFLLGHFFNTFWHTLNFLLLISFMNFFLALL